jgi:hypothetical protein
MELCRRGWTLLADGITRVSWNGAAAVAWPGGTRLKLWRDACMRFGLNPNELERVRAGLEMSYVPVQAAEAPASFTTVVRLMMGARVGLARFPSSDCAAALAETTFRPRMIGPMGLRARHAQMVAQVAGRCRPLGLDGARNCPIPELADCLVGAIR